MGGGLGQEGRGGRGAAGWANEEGRGGRVGRPRGRRLLHSGGGRNSCPGLQHQRARCTHSRRRAAGGQGLC